MKIVSFLFILLATFVFTGCDAKWGGVDPVLPPPPQVNNYSVFPPQTQPQVQPVPPANLSPVTAPLVLNPTQPQLQKAEAQSGSVGARTEKVWHPFRLPSRERPGMWKEVFIKVDLPTGVDLNTRNYAIAKHEKVLRDNGDCVEDYLPIKRSGPRQAR